MRARDTINDVLKNPVPSATQLIIDYEQMVGVLHQDCHQAPQTRTLFVSPISAALVNLMTNVTEQLEGYHSESDIGPALHAARQDSLSRWLDSLRIPRNVDSLQQVKELWELGSANCPPLQKWTVTMRNHRSETSGKNTSLLSQRKFIYNLFKKHNFDENDRNEMKVRPGKLYKILNSKEKKT